MAIRDKLHIVEGLCWAGFFILHFVTCLAVWGLMLFIMFLVGEIMSMYPQVSWKLVFGGAFFWAVLTFCFSLHLNTPRMHNSQTQTNYKKYKTCNVDYEWAPSEHQKIISADKSAKRIIELDHKS